MKSRSFAIDSITVAMNPVDRNNEKHSGFTVQTMDGVAGEIEDKACLCEVLPDVEFDIRETHEIIFSGNFTKNSAPLPSALSISSLIP